MADKLEFCSPAWVAWAGEYLCGAAADADLTGIRVTLNEVFTDAPSHLGADEHGRIGWYLRVADGRIEVSSGIVDDADVRITADYRTMLPLARMVFEGNPDNAQAAAAKAAEAAEAGLMRREGDPAALAGLGWISGLHDALAKRTA